MSCRKTSFTVFQRSRRELELRSRAQDFGRHGRPLNSKTTLPTRTRLGRRPGRSPRSGFCQRAERVNYVLKSHTCPSANVVTIWRAEALQVLGGRRHAYSRGSTL